MAFKLSLEVEFYKTGYINNIPGVHAECEAAAAKICKKFKSVSTMTPLPGTHF
jgi:hypothetical protein